MFSAAFAVFLIQTAPTLPAIANPASTYCISVGGRLEIVTTKKGEIGICVLPNGRRIEEWKLYRRAAKREKSSPRT